MARPRKNNAEYFSHDNDMRNDKKILAVRTKYGIEGYAIYCMLLETLCEADFFKLKIDDNNIFLMSGDFRIDAEKLKEIINFFISIDLLQKTKYNELYCRGLDNRLKHLLDKREEERVKYSIVKESKVKYSKRNSQKLPRNSQKPAETPISTAETIYNHWQEKKIIQHNKITDEIKRAINTAIKNYSSEDICSAINNYSNVVHSPDHYFNYKWTLKDFLKRGLEKFLDNADPLNNFKRDNQSKGVKATTNKYDNIKVINATVE